MADETGAGSPQIHIWEPSCINRTAWPVTTGIPFPRGMVRPGDGVSVWDGKTRVDADTTVTATWDDGSVAGGT